jgi:hypothetical protein
MGSLTAIKIITYLQAKRAGKKQICFKKTNFELKGFRLANSTTAWERIFPRPHAGAQPDPSALL